MVSDYWVDHREFFLLISRLFFLEQFLDRIVASSAGFWYCIDPKLFFQIDFQDKAVRKPSILCGQENYGLDRIFVVPDQKEQKNRRRLCAPSKALARLASRLGGLGCRRSGHLTTSLESSVK
jgi:hypothetical protein